MASSVWLVEKPLRIAGGRYCRLFPSSPHRLVQPVSGFFTCGRLKTDGKHSSRQTAAGGEDVVRMATISLNKQTCGTAGFRSVRSVASTT